MGLADSCVETPMVCPIGFSKCYSSTMVTEIGNISTTIQKKKKCSAGCRSGSLNLGTVKLSTSCCSTHFCNAKYPPDPRTNTPNGNKCYYCDYRSCSNILSCSGSEDRCFKSAVTLRGTPVVVKGCISASFCDIQKPTYAMDISCCEGNLCNGDNSVTHGVTQSSMYNNDKSVTQSFMHKGAKSVTQGVTQSSMHNSDKSATQSFMHKGAKRATQSFIHSFMLKAAKMVTQSSIYNSAPSVTQSFLFLCGSLLSYFLLHQILQLF
ncbi:uncharacterized protein [Pseudorasbora parva]|uniref:uncharacterized protein n=1 Tax=Pseudorasbora parva TaxID=51549 RepID=UPI00351EADDB